MPFPSDLDILRPCSSRTKPWMNTLGNGMLWVFSMPMKIILETQNVMMSYAVTKTPVG